MKLKRGRKYNFKGQPERLVYLGHNFSGNGYWHQFAKVETPSKVWAEVLTSHLHCIEESKEEETVEEKAERLQKERDDIIRLVGKVFELEEFPKLLPLGGHWSNLEEYIERVQEREGE